jgi:Family of unknown function (DUF5695)
MLQGLAGLILLLSATSTASAADAKNSALRLDAGEFSIALDRESQTLLSLAPKGAGGFDFAPAAQAVSRRGDGYYYLGDIDLRVRLEGEAEWRDYSTAHERKRVSALPAGGNVLAAADLSAALPASIPLRVERRWSATDGALVLRFRLTNRAARAVEIGGLGLPMVFDNILTDRTLAQAHTQASFADPYIGRDAGYLQVTRLNGAGPVLLVVPETNTPFEAYKPILDDATKRSQTFEGFYDWMVASRGFAETEWKGAQQWSPPTSITLARGETREIGLRFVLAPSIRGIESTLSARDRPVAVGIPGYVLPFDLPAHLFLQAARRVKTIEVSPQHAIEVTELPASQGWARYRVMGRKWGRARLDITYADGQVQAVHYFVTKPTAVAIGDMGRFLTTHQWFEDGNDPFRRAPSIMSYDRDEERIVLQDQRVWIAGLSDEGGAGAWLAAIMKQLGAPDADEIAKFERFVTRTLDGRLQVNTGPEKFGVRKSLFFYDPKALPAFQYDPAVDWSTWSSWNPKHANSVGRSFNYVHVAAAYWVLYRLARYREGLVHAHDWRWYLDRAYQTSMAMPRLAPEHARFGQMEGDVFVDILKDLQREEMVKEACALEVAMRKRASRWASEPYPFGSEMPWDSTGQPEVYAWMRYFGNTAKAELTREAILGYTPAIPSWGYNGNARRYWDFLYAGKTKRLERQIHHYGSANNAIPLLDAYRRDPSDFQLLRIAYGGLMGTTTNIDEQGFGSAAFHSGPDMMRFDGYSGDYGTGFFGLAYATAAYLVDHPTFGPIGFGGEVSEHGDALSIVPRDGFRTRVFVASVGLWLTLDAGKFQRVDYERRTGAVILHLDPADSFTPKAYLNVATTIAHGREYRPVGDVKLIRGSHAIALSGAPTTLILKPIP